MREWGTAWPFLGRARRVTFVVGKDRRILSRYRNELGFQAHVDAALRTLATRAR